MLCTCRNHGDRRPAGRIAENQKEGKEAEDSVTPSPPPVLRRALPACLPGLTWICPLTSARGCLQVGTPAAAGEATRGVVIVDGVATGGVFQAHWHNHIAEAGTAAGVWRLQGFQQLVGPPAL